MILEDANGARVKLWGSRYLAWSVSTWVTEESADLSTFTEGGSCDTTISSTVWLGAFASTFTILIVADISGFSQATESRVFLHRWSAFEPAMWTGAMPRPSGLSEGRIYQVIKRQLRVNLRDFKCWHPEWGLVDVASLFNVCNPCYDCLVDDFIRHG